MNDKYDVIVGGAGPVGLFLACELALAGASVLVLERDAEKNPLMMAFPLGLRGLNALSTEAFQRRGLLADIAAPEDAELTAFRRAAGVRFAGHFAGIMLDADKFDMTRWKYRSELSPLGARTDLQRIDDALTKRASELGVTILRGSAVTGHSQTDSEVLVHAGDATYTAKYLVACDGGRSKIRKDAGFEFIGSAPEFTGYTVLCDLDHPEKLRRGFIKTPHGMYISMASGHVGLMHFDGGTYDRSQELSVEHFERVLQYVSGTDVRVKAIRFGSTFTDRALLASTYRKGRVFLAGDAAHIHSPLGGQGLNAGLGDALNLGWKLAAVVQGTAPPELLDSYERERLPIGEWVTEWTRAQVNILQPTLTGYAAYSLMQALIETTDGTNYFVDQVRGFAQRYDLGSEHPLVGANAPHFMFEDATQVEGAMRGGKGIVYDFTPTRALADVAAQFASHVVYVDSHLSDRFGLNALVVRPDGIVAWLTEDACEVQETQDVQKLLSQWFGGETADLGDHALNICCFSG